MDKLRNSGMTPISNGSTPIDRADRLMVIAPLAQSASSPEERLLSLIIFVAINMGITAWLAMRLWQRWRWRRAGHHRSARWACPVCRRHADAAFIDCRAGDCVVNPPLSRRPEEESYV